jgi:ribosomal RNA-processing protein 9
MPDSFFQLDKKRKRSKPGGGGGGGRAGPSSRSKPPRRQEKDEELESDAEGEGANVDLDSMDFRAGRGDEDIHSDEELIDEHETAAEKRVRMAKGYLAKVRKELQEGEFTGDEVELVLMC